MKSDIPARPLKRDCAVWCMRLSFKRACATSLAEGYPLER
jgi:hypothetical protein